jgi:LacI family transcriptional regulator
MATIYDVARSAGVSPKTVSRVLNGDGPVGQRTRDKVEKAMSKLGYVPSNAARAMRSNRSGLVGLITGAISSTPSNVELSGLPELFIVQGIQRAIEPLNMTLMISDTGGRLYRVPQLMRTFAEHRVEGLIYVADYHKKVNLPDTPDIGKVVIANGYDEQGTPCVLPHDEKGQYALVSEAITKGHRRIGYLTLANALDATRLRTAGYARALADAGIAYDPALVIEADMAEPDPEVETQLLWDAIDRILGLENPPTLLCMGNDRMAMRAYGILRSRGLNLPGDISIAGYDNYRTLAETLYPPLTTVELPYAAMGVRAAQLLMSLIREEGQAPSEPQLVSGPVCWRDSVVPLVKPNTNVTPIGRKKT